ncbi:MAG: site-specific integrase [Synergistaceae bacterium]|nr:site-specific integrase [Synergistaceae bacterium]
MASIVKRGKSYRVQVSMPDGKGGYIRKSSTYTPPPGTTPTLAKRGANKYAIEFEEKCKGLLAYNENMTLDELHEWYMTDIAPNRLKGQYARTNKRFYNYYIQPVLGRCKLRQLTPVVLDRAFKQIQERGGIKKYYTLTSVSALNNALQAVNGTYRKMVDDGIICNKTIKNITRGGRTFKDRAQVIADFCNVTLDSLFTLCPSKPLSANTVNTIKQMLGALLTAARRKGVISNNPMVNTEPIKVTDTSRPVMNIRQALLFLKRLAGLDNISVRALLLVALYTGMRSGELRALKWTDINIQSCLIRVSKTLDDMNNVTPPKSTSSIRYVQIDYRLAAFLSSYYRELQAYISSMNGLIKDNGLVFPAITTGGYMNKDYPGDVIKGLIIDTDIPQNLHLHSLRHCFASIQINTGADAKSVQAALGHARVTSVLDIYSHVFAETLARNAHGVSFALIGDGDSVFGNETQADILGKETQNETP